MFTKDYITTEVEKFILVLNEKELLEAHNFLASITNYVYQFVEIIYRHESEKLMLFSFNEG